LRKCFIKLPFFISFLWRCSYEIFALSRTNNYANRGDAWYNSNISNELEINFLSLKKQIIKEFVWILF
jgi:hypothetical protein